MSSASRDRQLPTRVSAACERCRRNKSRVSPPYLRFLLDLSSILIVHHMIIKHVCDEADFQSAIPTAHVRFASARMRFARLATMMPLAMG